jgi:hypothetical protein
MGCFHFQSNAFWMALTFDQPSDRFSHQMEAAAAIRLRELSLGDFWKRACCDFEKRQDLSRCPSMPTSNRLAPN